jgi:hypothetical protein
VPTILMNGFMSDAVENSVFIICKDLCIIKMLFHWAPV